MSGYRRMMGHRDAARSHLQALPWPSGEELVAPAGPHVLDLGSGILASVHPLQIRTRYSGLPAVTAGTSLTQGPGLASCGQGG